MAYPVLALDTGPYLTPIAGSKMFHVSHFERGPGCTVQNHLRSGPRPRTTNLMLTLLGAVLDRAIQEDLIARNVVKMIKPAKVPQRKPTFWSIEQAHHFLEIMATDRLHAAWGLALLGLRRGELLGLRWTDVDLEAKTIAICHTPDSGGNPGPRGHTQDRDQEMPASPLVSIEFIGSDHLTVCQMARPKSGEPLAGLLGTSHSHYVPRRTAKCA